MILPKKSRIKTAGTVILIGRNIVSKDTEISPEPKPIVALTKKAIKTIIIPMIMSKGEITGIF
jgi:hypothetical protein